MAIKAVVAKTLANARQNILVPEFWSQLKETSWNTLTQALEAVCIELEIFLLDVLLASDTIYA